MVARRVAAASLSSVRRTVKQKGGTGMAKSKRPTPVPKARGSFKSAASGRFVSSHYAKTHPKTTYKLGRGK